MRLYMQCLQQTLICSRSEAYLQGARHDRSGFISRFFINFPQEINTVICRSNSAQSVRQPGHRGPSLDAISPTVEIERRCGDLRRTGSAKTREGLYLGADVYHKAAAAAASAAVTAAASAAAVTLLLHQLLPLLLQRRRRR